MNHYADKENDHPNVPRRNKIVEEDFNSICKQYVLEGERLKVKSFIYKDQKKVNPKKQQPIPMQVPQQMTPMSLQNMTEKDIKKLQYLQQMGVLNEEEKQILGYFRQNNKRLPPTQSKIAQNKSKLLHPSNNLMYNTPVYNGQNVNPPYYGYNGQYNGQFNGPQIQYNNFPSKMNSRQNPQHQMISQDMNQYNQYNEYVMTSRTQNTTMEMNEQTYY